MSLRCSRCRGSHVVFHWIVCGCQDIAAAGKRRSNCTPCADSKRSLAGTKSYSGRSVTIPTFTLCTKRSFHNLLMKVSFTETNTVQFLIIYIQHATSYPLSLAVCICSSHLIASSIQTMTIKVELGLSHTGKLESKTWLQVHTKQYDFCGSLKLNDLFLQQWQAAHTLPSKVLITA